MEQLIQKRVAAMTRDIEDELANETGVESSLSEVEVKQYLHEVIEEVRKGKPKTIANSHLLNANTTQIRFSFDSSHDLYGPTFCIGNNSQETPI
jgi:hypothetical protein